MTVVLPVVVDERLQVFEAVAQPLRISVVLLDQEGSVLSEHRLVHVLLVKVDRLGGRDVLAPGCADGDPTVHITPGGQSTDESYTFNLLFADNCSAQTVSRAIRLRYYGADDVYVFRYNGNVPPLLDNSAGSGLRFDLYKESGLSPIGAVENDPDADDGKVFRIQDDSMSKVKYRVTKADGNPVGIANEVGATIVGRVKVRSVFGT